MKRRTIGLVAAALVLTTTAGCGGRNRTLPPDPPSASNNDGQLGTEDGSTAGAVTPGSRADFLQSVPSDRIFFAFDSFSIDAEARGTLDAQAQWLTANPMCA